MQGTQGAFPTIKALVFDQVHRTRGLVDPEELARVVLEHFPESAWKATHWAWYRYQITKGRFRDEFSAAERENLRGRAPAPELAQEVKRPGDAIRTPAPKLDREVKRIGDAILSQVRSALSQADPEDANLRFKLNRWVYARLQLDERREKPAIKHRLWDGGKWRCPIDGTGAESLKGLDLHRIDPTLGYSVENCVLLHRLCHQRLR